MTVQFTPNLPAVQAATTQSVAPKAQPAKPENRVVTQLADAYTQFGPSVETGIVNVSTAVRNTLSKKDPFNPTVVTDYKDVLQSMKGAAQQTAVMSGVRNGFNAFRGKQAWSQAGGNVTADVFKSATSNGVSSVATNATIYLMASKGAGSFPIMVGGIVAGTAASYATDYAINKTGAYQFVQTKATETLKKLGVK